MCFGNVVTQMYMYMLHTCTCTCNTLVHVHVTQMYVDNTHLNSLLRRHNFIKRTLVLIYRNLKYDYSK